MFLSLGHTGGLHCFLLSNIKKARNGPTHTSLGQIKSFPKPITLSSEADLPKGRELQAAGDDRFWRRDGGFCVGSLSHCLYPYSYVRETAHQRGPAAVFIAILLIFMVTFFVNGVRSALVTAVMGVILCSYFVGGRLRLRALTGVALCLILGLVGWTISLNITHGGALDRFASVFADPSSAYLRDRVPFYQQLPDILYHSSMGIGLGSTGPVEGYLGPHYGLGFVPFTRGVFRRL